MEARRVKPVRGLGRGEQVHAGGGDVGFDINEIPLRTKAIEAGGITGRFAPSSGLRVHTLSERQSSSPLNASDCAPGTYG